MEYKYYIRKIYQVPQGVVILELGDKKGVPVFDFKPGQYVMISYVNEKGGLERKHAFSLASSPAERDRIKLGIKIGGKFTQGLLRLNEGDQVLVNGPFGSFVFDESKHQDLVFLAGGIGITPFYSAIKYATDKNLPNKLTLLYSNKTVDGTLFFREIRALEEQNKNFRALFSVTDKNVLPVLKGVVNRRVDAAMINDFTGGVSGKTFFICGPAGFMKSMRGNLLELGVDPSKIETEGFSMIAGAGFLAGTKNTAYAMGFSGALMLASFYLIANPGGAASNGKEKLDLVSSLFGNASAAEEQPASNPVSTAEQALADLATTTGLDPVGSAVGSGLLALAGIDAQSGSLPAAAPVGQPQPGKPSSPAPVTRTSPFAAESAAKATVNKPTTQSPAKAQSAPAPTTSASIPAETAPAAPAPSANKTPAAAVTQLPAPAPVTSVSAPAAAPAAPTTNAAAPTASVSTPAPAPTTSASVPAAAPAPTVTSQPAPSTPSAAPAPTTSASAPAPAASSPSTPATVTSPVRSNTADTSGRNRHDDDD